MSEYVSLTIHRCEDDPGMVVGNNICIAVLWLVDLQVGVLPGELLSWINRLTDTERREVYREMGWSESSVYFCLWFKLIREQSEESRPKEKVTQKQICYPSYSPVKSWMVFNPPGYTLDCLDTPKIPSSLPSTSLMLDSN